jgi:hypothetical protein
MKSSLIFSLLVSVVIIFYLWLYLDNFELDYNSSGKRNMAKKIAEVSYLDNNLSNQVQSAMQIERFSNCSNGCDTNGYPVQPDVIFPPWEPATLARLQRTMANDDPLHHYLDGVNLYSKLVNDKIVVKLDDPLNFRNVISLVMDFAEARLVRTMSFNLEINDGKTTKTIENIDHNCTAPELVVKNGQLLFIILPVPSNTKRSYTLKWFVFLNGTSFELMTRTVAL